MWFSGWITKAVLSVPAFFADCYCLIKQVAHKHIREFSIYLIFIIRALFIAFFNA